MVAGSGDVAVALPGSALRGGGHRGEPCSVSVLGLELSQPPFSRGGTRFSGRRALCQHAWAAFAKVSASWQVLIFAEKKADVDAIHEYLLLKGVEAVAIHGGKGR